MATMLKDICSFQSGGTPSKANPAYFGGNIPWITTVALNGRSIGCEDAVDWITEEAIQETAAKITFIKNLGQEMFSFTTLFIFYHYYIAHYKYHSDENLHQPYGCFFNFRIGSHFFHALQ